MKDRKQPRFSIVIPCYNEAACIGETIKSLKRQDYNGRYEIIVVDNNCTDETAEISQKLGANVVTEHRPGVCWARQKGTEEARGEIVISTDADTIYSKKWLRKIDETFKRDDEIVAVTGPFHYEGGPRWAIYAKMLFKTIHVFYSLTGRVSYAPGANLAFKKEAWDGYNTLMTQYGDEIDQLRKLRRKGKVVFNDEIVVYTSPRRLHQGFFYNFIVSYFIYSVLEYNLNRLFKRRFFGQAPAFRDEV